MNYPAGEKEISELRAKLTAAENMKPFPVSAQQLLQEFGKPEPDIDQVIQLIECDPAVAAKLLSMANGPLYSTAYPISSIGHSLVVLGMQTVVQLVTAVSTGEMFLGGNATTAKYRKEIYRQSLGCASVNRVIAESLMDECGDEAFLVGVMQDVGQLVFLNVLDEKYIKFQEECTGCPIELETNAFGIDHATIGERSAKSWGIPQDIHVAVGNHHNDISQDEHPLSRIATIGQLLAKHWGLGYSAPTDQEIEFDFISKEQMEEFQPEAAEVFEAISELCSIN